MGKRKKRSSKQRTTFKKDNVQFLGNFTLPGFHYLGPGGNSSNGPPTNAVDAIAKEHDEAYDHAMDDFKKAHDAKHCVEEIQKADEKFLAEMEGVKASSAMEAVGKVVGLAGIGLKAAVEHSLGHTLYPAFDKMVDPSLTNCNRFQVRAGDELN